MGSHRPVLRADAQDAVCRRDRGPIASGPTVPLLPEEEGVDASRSGMWCRTPWAASAYVGLSPRACAREHLPARGNRRKGGGAMGLLRMVVAVLFVAAALAFPAAAAAQTPSIKGGGTTEEMTQFALAISAGRGHFECLMPALMNVQATVIGAEV